MIKPSARLVQLTRFFEDSGHGWRAPLPALVGSPDSVEWPTGSGLRLFENGQELGPGHAPHDSIRSEGMGRYSHWGSELWFSASDNSDPRQNGRVYHILAEPDERLARLFGISASLSDVAPDDRVALHHCIRRFAMAVDPQFLIPDHGRRMESDEPFLDRVAQFRSSGDSAMVFDRRYALKELAKLTDGVPGAFAECGVHAGASAIHLAHFIRERGQPRDLHLFDSFQGLSPPTQEDGACWREGDLAVGIEVVQRNLTGFSGVHLHAGWIPERFPEVADRQFAFVHIDVDLYEPTWQSLEFFYPRLAPGGLLVCDDYGFATCPGATKAMDTWFADRPEAIVNLPSGGAFIIKR
ncbi:TylF/MycF family methyltransferase [Azospirillum canadense]|uniref:TylF/MycF family methyltransferase n=1 Tax=Azospirillum canadense TaxID=403962 RepID=UPI00222628E9|nr:TylF/MycF family methyltransferase [Azospirillum canadense]MCW2240995.1 putative O-methyltransferase YrrM [Azospirillum canadense]